MCQQFPRNIAKFNIDNWFFFSCNTHLNVFFVFPGFASPLDSQNPSREDYQSKHISDHYISIWRQFWYNEGLSALFDFFVPEAPGVFFGLMLKLVNGFFPNLWMRFGSQWSLDTFRRFLMKTYNMYSSESNHLTNKAHTRTHFRQKFFIGSLKSSEIRPKPIFVEELRRNKPVCPFATSRVRILHRRWKIYPRNHFALFKEQSLSSLFSHYVWASAT